MSRDDLSNDAPLDVLIVGAGISGIGCACYLTRELPEKTWLVLEAREALGGTWDLFRYPGIRSDSDLFTFGYDFRPWQSDKAIAGGEEILNYLRETAAEYGVDRKIRFRTKVISADWDSATALWTVVVEQDGAQRAYRARWVFGATGYYDYAGGYRPSFPGEATFTGPIIHPQHWPQDLDYKGKRVAIIGSGATAITLVPAMADAAAHVTQIQRTPTYVMTMPAEERVFRRLRRFMSARAAGSATRIFNARRQRLVWLFARKFPKLTRRLIRKQNISSLPEGYAVDRHFNPPYAPWDQRMCAVPDGDLFKAVSSGKASIVTGHIERFEPRGVRMTDGELVPADIIVTATGLNLIMLGGMTLSVDGKCVDPSEHLVFKGTMLDGVPNFCFAVGYTNSSWTLKVTLLCSYFCRLLKLMDQRGMASVVARRPATGIEERPLLDFAAGYVQRSVASMPKQGTGQPWAASFNFFEDRRLLTRGRVDDPALEFAPEPAVSIRRHAA